MMSESAKDACAQAKALADELGKQTRGIKVDMFRKFTSGLKVASSVLPGNPITREYDAGHLTGSGGPDGHWKIYSGVKKSTKQEVSIFLFEKKVIEGLSKGDREYVLDFLRSGVSRLTRLRHPRLLTVQHPLEESRDSLAFCTEPVFGSLANVLDKKGALFKNFELHEVEIKYGLLQVSEALAFLHRDVKMIHRNLTPENVYINNNGSWKVGGFECCLSNSAQAGEPASYPCPHWNPNSPTICQPNLDYMAPEYFLTLMCGPNSDMYSVGVLFHALFNDGRPVSECKGSYSNQKSQFEKRKTTSAVMLNSIPVEARDHVKLLLNLEPSVRPDAEQLSKIPFFEDVGAMALHFLDTLFEKDNLARSKFYRSLPAIIKKLPKRVCLQRVLTCLANELHHKEMVPFILPNIFIIGEQATGEEYNSFVQPLLLPLMLVQDPIQILLIFMQNMSIILAKAKQQHIKEHVLPMIYRALEAPHPEIQELCLVNLPAFASMLDYNSFRNSIIPRIKKLAIDSTAVSVRVNCLVCLGKILEHCDKWLVLDEVLPILPLFKTSEPAILMAVLGIYKTALTHPKLGITLEILAGKVLPFLIPIMMESSLSLSQFDAFSKVIQQMITQVETERRSQLTQLQTASDTSMPDDFSEDGLKKMMLGQKEIGEATPKPSPQRTSTKTANSLTLEEKMRLAKEQENTNMMKRQSPIKISSSATPTAAASISAPFQSSASASFGQSASTMTNTKDLTQTLLKSTPFPAAAPSRTVNPASAASSFSGLTPHPSRTGQVMSQMPTPLAPGGNAFASATFAPTTAVNTMPSAPQPTFGGIAAPFSASTMPMQINPGLMSSQAGLYPNSSSFLAPQTVNPNLSNPTRFASSSSLDNLLPFGGQGRPPSLNQMVRQPPALPPSQPLAGPCLAPLASGGQISLPAPNTQERLAAPLIDSGKVDAALELDDFLG